MGESRENGRGEEWQFSTIAAQAGFCQGAGDNKRSSRTEKGKSICAAAVWEFDSLEELQASPYIYRRIQAPNADDLAHAVASLESAEAGVATSSGMGAVVAATVSLMKSGDTLVVHSDTYGGTFTFFNMDLRRFGISVEYVDVLGVAELEAHLSSITTEESPEPSALSALQLTDPTLALGSSSGRTVVVFCETITNPLIRVADIVAISAVCKRHGALLIVDNTFGTPVRAKPLLQGADIVVHSGTKFLGGHSDLLAGAVVGPSKYMKGVQEVTSRWGLTASPFDAWLCTRGIRTLEVRVLRAWATAEELARRLSALDGDSVRGVNYASRCAVFSFEVPEGEGERGAMRLLAALRLIKLAPSLGGVTTTVSHPASTSHAAVPPQERDRLGIRGGLLRISTGLEDVDDLWADLQRGIRAAAPMS